MFRKISISLVSLLIALGPINLVVTGHAAPDYEITPSNWGPLPGDMIIFDTENNIGYISHPNGKQLVFPIITGQRRTLSYIGLRYSGATPKQRWVAQEKVIQWDRYTYGPDGRFFRLFLDGKKTHYGIHAHDAEDYMFAQENRYQSMGCPIVKKEILDVIEQTFIINGGRIDVETI